MINGNINEFCNKLWGGEELIYTYNGKKYFSQGEMLNGLYRFELQMWELEQKMLWSVSGKTHQESYEEFMKTPLFDGLTFWEAEKNVEWVDY